ncbi:hypothetical protein DFP74_5000 [Nocardiopsis sp. Huas11]|nr:hypothetical protein DFP74_5000 [Nocardiopsis sp. Huas11]
MAEERLRKAEGVGRGRGLRLLSEAWSPQGTFRVALTRCSSVTERSDTGPGRWQRVRAAGFRDTSDHHPEHLAERESPLDIASLVRLGDRILERLRHGSGEINYGAWVTVGCY